MGRYKYTIKGENMGRYKYTIKGENINFKNVIGLKKDFEEASIRKQKWKGRTANACDYCVIGYPYSCLAKKVNGENIECEGYYYFVSSSMDFLTLIKEKRF